VRKREEREREREEREEKLQERQTDSLDLHQICVCFERLSKSDCSTVAQPLSEYIKTKSREGVSAAKLNVKKECTRQTNLPSSRFSATLFSASRMSSPMSSSIFLLISAHSNKDTKRAIAKRGDEAGGKSQESGGQMVN